MGSVILSYSPFYKYRRTPALPYSAEVGLSLFESLLTSFNLTAAPINAASLVSYSSVLFLLNLCKEYFFSVAIFSFEAQNQWKTVAVAYRHFLPSPRKETSVQDCTNAPLGSPAVAAGLLRVLKAAWGSFAKVTSVGRFLMPCHTKSSDTGRVWFGQWWGELLQIF